MTPEQPEAVLELGRRSQRLPAPPRIVFASLTDPHAAGSRPWLALERGEVEPRVLEAVEPGWVVWSSLWPDRPQERIELELTAVGADTALRFTLLTPGELPQDWPGDGVVGRMRRRLNHLLYADLRFSYGQ